MSLVFASFVPHPPLLIPQIGKDNLDRLKKTAQGYAKLAARLKASGAESIIVISPHGVISDTYYQVNLSPQFAYQYEEFGDFATKGGYAGDFVLAHWLKKDKEQKSIIHLITEPNLDHGTSVPLFLLSPSAPAASIVPLYYSGRSYRDHYHFGQLLAKPVRTYHKKVAVIASGDLSHRVTKDAPGRLLAQRQKIR